MEDFIQKQAEEIFEKIDSQILAYTEFERDDFPDMSLINEAVACAYTYNSPKNLRYINRLMCMLETMKDRWGEWVADTDNHKDLSLYFLLGVPKHIRTEAEINQHREVKKIVFNPAYKYLYKGITLSEYVEPLRKVKEGKMMISNTENQNLVSIANNEAVKDSVINKEDNVAKVIELTNSVKPPFNNVFNGITDIDIIKNHFISLTHLKSKNGKPHLTEQQLDDFIMAGFVEKNNSVKIKMNFEEGERVVIRELFYSFYTFCYDRRNKYDSKKGKKREYVKLLTDYFEDWDYSKVSPNFNKRR